MGITLGSSSAPSSITQYLDALFSQSLANYSKKLIDNIASTNAFFHMMRKAKYYESADGGTDIRQPLLYAYSQMADYDGADELEDGPIDGVTQAVEEWRQSAVAISYNMREVIQNKEKLIDLVDTKITQAELGFQEGWAERFFYGSGDAATRTPKTNPGNGALSFNPIAKLIDYTPTTSTAIHNINQSDNSWWRNRKKESAATTYLTLLAEMDNLYNTCSRGPGGPPDLILTDQTTYELMVQAIYQKWSKQNQSESDNFPFEYTKFKKAKIVWDEKMIDAHSDLTNTDTYGTAYFINTKFFRIKYIKGRDFEMLKNDDGKIFQKPIKGDSRLGHMAWMGQIMVNNRRKHGVLGKIARTLT